MDDAEMFQVFNMGIGMTVVVAAKDAGAIRARLKGRIIGRIEAGSGVVRLQ